MAPPRILGTLVSSPRWAAPAHPSLARESNAFSVFYIRNKVTIENGPQSIKQTKLSTEAQ